MENESQEKYKKWEKEDKEWITERRKKWRKEIIKEIIQSTIISLIASLITIIVVMQVFR